MVTLTSSWSAHTWTPDRLAVSRSVHASMTDQRRSDLRCSLQSRLACSFFLGSRPCCYTKFLLSAAHYTSLPTGHSNLPCVAARRPLMLAPSLCLPSAHCPGAGHHRRGRLHRATPAEASSLVGIERSQRSWCER